jgi:outer membrane protein TolC
MTTARESSSGRLLLSSLASVLTIELNSAVLFDRIEAENRQLHQIVSQLRTARRTTQENAETAFADRQSSRETIEQQRKELNDLREKLKNYHIITEENTHLLETVDTFSLPWI